MPVLTVSGNEQTDLTRALGTQGDGIAAPDSSFGIWPAATNSITNGGFETNTTGYSIVGALGQDWARVTTDHKFGSACLELTRITNGAGTEGAQFAGIPISASTQYTASVWIKVVSGNPANITFGTTDGTGGSGITLTGATLGGWTRYSVTWTTAVGATTAAVQLFSTNGATSDKYRSDGWQLELGPVATPYIETNGSTATRAACRVQAPASLLTAAQSWAAFRFRCETGTAATTSASGVIRLMDWRPSIGSPNIVAIAQDNYGSSTWSMYYGDVTFLTVAQQTPAAIPVGGMVTLVAAWSPTDVRISVNGAAYTISTVNAGRNPIGMPATFELGDILGGAAPGYLYGELLWAAVGMGTAPDPTQSFLLSNNDPTLGQFTQANDCRAVMPFNTTAYDAASGLLTATLSLPQELTGVVTIS